MSQKVNTPSDKIIAALRPLYTEKYQEIRLLHENGARGLTVVRELSDLADEIIRKGFHLINPVLSQQWGGAMIAIGGYGRQQLSPASDIDLMFLFTDAEPEESKAATSELLRVLWDLGYKVGHSVRTVEESVALAREDRLIATSLLESRFLHGDRSIFKTFHASFFEKVIDKHLVRTLNGLKQSRKEVREEYGATHCLLEPDIKQSPGALRDIHTLKWVASVRYRTHHLPQIHQWGHLSTIEYTALIDAQNFLWRLRSQLHFIAGKVSDLLTIELQEELAPFFKYDDRRGLMHEYYMHAEKILEISDRFTRDAFPVSRRDKWRRSWKTKQIAKGFQLFSGEISVQSLKPFEFLENDENTMRLFLLAKTHSARIADPILEILNQVSESKKDVLLAPGAMALFKTLMTEPGGIAKTIRVMHRVKFLWRIIPEFSRVHCLVQESRSHAFTVDEHTFRVLETAEGMMNEPGPIHLVYAGVKRKDILHMAILLHDIGKGRKESNSEVGATVAAKVAADLSYTEDEQKRLVLLVRQHLSFSQVALFRDFEDEPVLHQFVKEIPDIALLKKLYVLTCADIRATSPGIWTEWKGDLLRRLYKESTALLTGKDLDPKHQKAVKVKAKINQSVEGKYPEAWISEILSSLTYRYLMITSFDQVLIDLSALFHLKTNPIQVKAQFLSDQGVTEYTLYAYDWIATGIFSKMTGVLAAKGLQIQSAQVWTHPNGIIIDTFKVIDPDHTERVSESRVSEISEEVQRVLTGDESVEHLFSKGRRYTKKDRGEAKSQVLRIEVDNHSSRSFTVIDIYTTDKRGLLFVIARSILDLGLFIYSAKIATRLDQVVDIFYVLGLDQKKLTNPELIQELKDHLRGQIQSQLSGEGTGLQ